MSEDKSQALLAEIDLLFKRANIKELHESSCEKLPQKIMNLVASYEEQKKKMPRQ